MSNRRSVLEKGTHMKLQYLSANTDSNKFANQLEKDGALIITDVIRQSETEQLITEIGPFIDNTPTSKDDFSGYNTKNRPSDKQICNVSFPCHEQSDFWSCY